LPSITPRQFRDHNDDRSHGNDSIQLVEITELPISRRRPHHHAEKYFKQEHSQSYILQNLQSTYDGLFAAILWIHITLRPEFYHNSYTVDKDEEIEEPHGPPLRQDSSKPR